VAFLVSCLKLIVTLQQGDMGKEFLQVWLYFEKRILIERQAKVCGILGFLFKAHCDTAAGLHGQGVSPGLAQLQEAG